MTLGDAITKFFHDMGIMELRLRNKNPHYAKLSYNSSLYLDIIAAHQGEYTPSRLADMLHVARPSVTQKLNQLEKDGYIIKKQGEIDKREYYLYFNTSCYDKATGSAYAHLENHIEQKIKECYTKEEIDKFSEILSFIGDICIDDIL